MVMIPVVPAPSRRTRELTEKLEQAIRDYERDHPNLSPAEIQHALQIMSVGSGRRETRTGVRVIALIIAVAIAVGTTIASRREVAGVDGGSPAPWIGIGVVLLLLGMLMLAVRRRND